MGLHSCIMLYTHIQGDAIHQITRLISKTALWSIGKDTLRPARSDCKCSEDSCCKLNSTCRKTPQILIRHWWNYCTLKTVDWDLWSYKSRLLGGFVCFSRKCSLAGGALQSGCRPDIHMRHIPGIFHILLTLLPKASCL